MDYNDILRTLENNLDRNETERDLWLAVTIVKKKDGSDFVNPTQSYKGATYHNKTYCAEPILTVYGQTKRCGYVSYDLNACAYEYGKGVTKIYTPDEMKVQIDEHIKRLNARIESYKAQIARSKEVFEAFELELKTLLKHLKEDCLDLRIPDKNGKREDPTSLEYACRDYMQKNYLYL